MFNVGAVQGYIKLNAVGWNTGIKRSQQSLAALSRTMMRTGAVTVATVGLMTREFGKFDRAIRHATSVSELSEAQFKAMSDMALDASVRWNKAATDTAHAFYYLGSAGLTAKEQMDAYNDTIMLSRATGADLALTTEGLVDIVRAFGLEFANTGYIADQITKTVISSNQTFEILRKSLSYASSTARQTNNTFAETAAMLGVMANAGIKGSMAGTVLRRAMTNLMSPTGAMADLMYELGISVYDTEGVMKPFINIIGEISDEIGGATDEYKNMVFEVLFGRRAIAGQIQLFNYGSDALKRYADEIAAAGGTTEKVAGKQMKAFTEQLGRVWRQVQRVSIMLGEKLAPVVRRIADELMSMTDAIEDYINNNSKAVAQTLKWVTALGTLAIAIPVVFKLASALTILTSPLAIAMAGLLLFRTLWTDTFKKGGVLATALDEFGDVLATWLEQNWGPFGKALSEFASLVKWIAVTSAKGWMLIGQSASDIMKAANKAYIKDMESQGMDMSGFTPPKFPWSTPDTTPKVPTQEVVKKGKEVGAMLVKAMVEQAKKDLKGLMDIIIMDVIPEDMRKILSDVKALINRLAKAYDKPIKSTADYMAKNFADQFVKSSWEAMKQRTVGSKTYTETKKVLHPLSVAWDRAMDEFFRPKEGMFNTWRQEIVTMLGSIHTAWTNTFADILADTSAKAITIKNVLMDMINGVRVALSRMLAEAAARSLMSAILGEKVGKGIPVIGKVLDWLGQGAKASTRTYSSYTPTPTGYSPAPVSGSGIGLSYEDVFAPKKAVASGREGMAAPKVAINIENKGRPVSAQETGRTWNGKEWVISVVMDEYNSNPNFRKALNSG